MVKIYVDSRHRIGGSNEDFVWQLPESVEIPESLAYVDVCLVPNVFWSIRPNVNDQIRWLEDVVTVENGSTTVYAHQATIPPGQYNALTLAEAMQTTMRTDTNLTPTDIAVEFNIASSRLQITCSDLYSQINIYPDGLLTGVSGNFNDAQGSFTLDPTNLQSAGKVCGFLGTARITASLSIVGLGDSVIDVQRHHCLYIHSSLATPGSSYGPLGQSDIIRRVLVDAPQNGLAIDRHTTAHDSVEVNGKTLQSMRFRLAGADGKTVDLRGHHWSFSLIFYPKM
jgi:hypothetical protein